MTLTWAGGLLTFCPLELIMNLAKDNNSIFLLPAKAIKLETFKQMNGNPLSKNTWREKLGLFPMPLFEDSDIEEKFILLNGSMKGNLCLDFGDESSNEARSAAWSADVGHYLYVGDRKVTVYRWDSYKSFDYSVESVASKLNSFYDFLRKQEVSRHDSVVKFCISIFREIRSSLRDGNGRDSLNSFLYLLSSIADSDTTIGHGLNNIWALNAEIPAIQSRITSGLWENLRKRLSDGLQEKGLTPDIKLILRHASGSLFQEAHFETLFPPVYQTNLFGDPDQNYETSRNQTSAHFTPTSVVRTLVEEALNNYNFQVKNELTVLDPACGSGEFLREFCRQVRLRGYRGRINIIGWDVSSTAIDMARFITNYEVRSYNELVNISIENRDALATGNQWDAGVDILLMNPPFISWETMDEGMRNNVQRTLSDVNQERQGRPNTAGAFLWNAVQCLSENGVIGCVLPTSIFENESYVQLRRSIQERIDVKIIGRLGSQTLFSETLVDTSIFLGCFTADKEQNPVVFWSDYKVESASTSLRELRRRNYLPQFTSIEEKGYSLYKNERLIQSDSWMPIPRKSFDLIARFENFPKVEELFDVYQGARTGLNAAFIVPKAFYRTLTAKEKKYFRPAVTNESINSGALNDSYYIFYPKSDQLPEEITNTNLEAIVPKYYYEYLLPNYKKLVNRKGIKEWWSLTRPRNWQQEYKAKIVSKEFGKAGDFAFDKDGNYVAERSHAWFPKGDRILGDIGYAYVAVLSMPIVNDFLTGLSKQLGGGDWWYLSSKYLNKMPIPNLFESGPYNQELIDLLKATGIRLSQGESVEKEFLITLSNRIFYA